MNIKLIKWCILKKQLNSVWFLVWPIVTRLQDLSRTMIQAQAPTKALAWKRFNSLIGVFGMDGRTDGHHHQK